MRTLSDFSKRLREAALRLGTVPVTTEVRGTAIRYMAVSADIPLETLIGPDGLSKSDTVQIIVRTLNNVAREAAVEAATSRERAIAKAYQNALALGFRGTLEDFKKFFESPAPTARLVK